MAWKQKFSVMKENGIKHLTIPSQTTIGLCELYKLKMTVVKWLDMYFQNFNLCDRVYCWKRIYHWWVYKWTTLPNKNHCRIQRWNMEGCGILSPWSYQSQCNHLRISYNGCWWFASIWNSVSENLNRESLDPSLINSHPPYYGISAQKRSYGILNLFKIRSSIKPYHTVTIPLACFLLMLDSAARTHNFE